MHARYVNARLPRTYPIVLSTVIVCRPQQARLGYFWANFGRPLVGNFNADRGWCGGGSVVGQASSSQLTTWKHATAAAAAAGAAAAARPATEPLVVTPASHSFIC